MSLVKSKHIRNAARGESCTFNITGHCNYNPETSVMAHLPSPISGYKSTDLASVAVSCSNCHDVIDGRVNHDVSQEDIEFYMRRAQTLTLNMLYEKGIVTVKGAA